MACKECGSPTKHKTSCSKSTAAPPLAKSAPKTAAKPRAVAAPPLDGFDPSALTDEQLAAAVHEAGRRAEDLRARAQRLEELVAEAAPRLVEPRVTDRLERAL